MIPWSFPILGPQNLAQKSHQTNQTISILHSATYTGACCGAL